MRVYTTRRGWKIVVAALLLMGVLPCCAGKKHLADEARAAESGEYLLFVSNVQGNPLCLFGTIQKMRVAPWIGPPRTRWRVHTWLVFPGGAPELFSERGKRKETPEVPLTWTRDSLLFTTDSDRFVFYRPFTDDKLLLLTDPIFPERARSIGEEDVRYTLLPGALIWNDRNVQGRVFYQEVETRSTSKPSGFPPLHGPQAGVRTYAIWVPGGMFLYMEKQSGTTEGGRASAVAIMQDRRGRWEETYHVILSEPEDLFRPSVAPHPSEGRTHLGIDIPLWRIQGSMEVVREVRSGSEPGTAPGAEAEGGAFWQALAALAGTDGEGPVRFCLLKGTLRVDGEAQLVYGVGITEP